MYRYRFVFHMLMIALMTGCASARGPGEEKAVAAVLDEFSDAASKADSKRYFALFAADGVFLGTDATERWTVTAFRAFVEPYFSKGQGWTYTPRGRHIAFDVSGSTAWFDESLWNDSYGVCRGTGVLVKQKDGWKIAQYNLMIPIPNEVAKEIVARIRAEGDKK